MLRITLLSLFIIAFCSHRDDVSFGYFTYMINVSVAQTTKFNAILLHQTHSVVVVDKPERCKPNERNNKNATDEQYEMEASDAVWQSMSAIVCWCWCCCSTQRRVNERS